MLKNQLIRWTKHIPIIFVLSAPMKSIMHTPHFNYHSHACNIVNKKPFFLFSNSEKQQTPSSSNLQLGNSSIKLRALIKSINQKGLSKEETVFLQNSIILLLGKIIQNIQKAQFSQNLKKQYNSVVTAVTSLCLDSFKQMLMKSKNKQQILKLVQNSHIINNLFFFFPTANLKRKALIINYVKEYHSDQQTHKKLLHLLQQPPKLEGQDPPAIIFYLKEILNFISTCTYQSKENLLNMDFLEKSTQLIYNKIMLVNPKMLFIFTKTLLIFSEQGKNFIQPKILFSAVSEHVTGLKMINSKNVLDYVYLLQVLGNLVSAGSKEVQLITKIAKQIHHQIKCIYKGVDEQEKQQKQNQDKEQHTQQVEDPTAKAQENNQQQQSTPLTGKVKLRMIDINITLDLMLKLSAIDVQLFTILQQQFFSLIQQTNFNSLASYIFARTRVALAVMANLKAQQTPTTPQKTRIIKQEHVKFILSLLEKLQTNLSLSPSEIAKLLQLCQKITSKSRKIKKILKKIIEQAESKGNMSAEEKAYIQIIMNGF